VFVRDQTTRWGSCSTSGALSFSWRLVLAPPFVLDYLAAHEVAHLGHMNHGPRFWSLVERTMPRHEEARNWLRKHGASLHRYGAEGALPSSRTSPKRSIE
jgi:predicted metal-dependent hydrolase